MTEKEQLRRAERVLSSLGRPVGHAAGLYRKFLPQLAELWDEEDDSLAIGARSKWQKIHAEAMDEHKAADDETDAPDTDVILDTDQE